MTETVWRLETRTRTGMYAAFCGIRNDITRRPGPVGDGLTHTGLGHFGFTSLIQLFQWINPADEKEWHGMKDSGIQASIYDAAGVIHGHSQCVFSMQYSKIRAVYTLSDLEPIWNELCPSRLYNTIPREESNEHETYPPIQQRNSVAFRVSPVWLAPECLWNIEYRAPDHAL